MGWRFRKSFKILPGIRMNIGKRGLSGFTIGRRGSSVGIGNQGTHLNTGLPGTGLSYRQRTGGPVNLAAWGSLVTIGGLLLGGIVMCGLCVGTGRNSSNSAVNPTPTPRAIVPLVSTPSPTPTPGKNSKKSKKQPNLQEQPSVIPVPIPVPRGRNGPKQSGYTLGPRGGCYYVNSYGDKTYVEHSLCN